MSSSQLCSIASYKENANKLQESDENVCNESNLQGSVETSTKSIVWTPYSPQTRGRISIFEILSILAMSLKFNCLINFWPILSKLFAI